MKLLWKRATSAIFGIGKNDGSGIFMETTFGKNYEMWHFLETTFGKNYEMWHFLETAFGKNYEMWHFLETATSAIFWKNYESCTFWKRLLEKL